MSVCVIVCEIVCLCVCVCVLTAKLPASVFLRRYSTAFRGIFLRLPGEE